MEFGRVDEKELDQIDFTLPPEPGFNKRIFNGKASNQFKIYTGCAKWGREEWVGKIYPPKTREKDFLLHYAQHYNSVELNLTHYKIYGEPGIRRWAEKVKGKDFLFCPKMYQGLTHRGKLDGRHPLLKEFLRGIVAFDAHLGPIFVQVSESFSPKRKKELFDFLLSLPKSMQFFLEVRHAGWFLKENERDDLFSFLRDNGIGAVISDTAGRRDCAHMHITLSKTFIRFVGNSLHPTDFLRIDQWVERISDWREQGMNEIYFFMHMHDEALSPDLSVYLVDKLNANCGLNLIRPKFIQS